MSNIERDKPFQPVGIMHMGVDKHYLLRIVREEGDWRDFFVGFKGTREEAIKGIEEDPREVFCSCDCEKAPNGACSGKKKP